MLCEHLPQLLSFFQQHRTSKAAILVYSPATRAYGLVPDFILERLVQSLQGRQSGVLCCIDATI